jgi:hypothetical protein
MLAAQLIASHCAAMECYRRAMLGEQTFEARHENLNQANKLSRSYAALLEALNRHRGKGAQKVTVEHVHVHEGGQAIVGNVEHPGGGMRPKTEDQPHAKQLTDAPGDAMPSQVEAEWEALPVAGRHRQVGVPDARREVAGRAEGQQERTQARALQPRGNRAEARRRRTDPGKPKARGAGVNGDGADSLS